MWKTTCSWSCINIFKQLWHSQTLSSSFRYYYISFKQSYKISVKKDWMRIILFRTYEHLKLYIILRIFHILKTFYIYQTLHLLSNKFKSLLSKFRKVLWYDREDKAVSSFFFDAKFDRQCEIGIKQTWTRTWTLEKTDLGPLEKPDPIQKFICYHFWQIWGCWFQIWQLLFKILVQKHPNKVFSFPDLGIFYIFSQNFALRQIRGWSFQISQ